MLEYPDMPRPRTVDVEEASLDVPKKRAPRKRAVPTNEDGEAQDPDDHGLHGNESLKS